MKSEKLIFCLMKKMAENKAGNPVDLTLYGIT